MLSREYSLTRNSIHVSFDNPVWHKIENGANVDSIQINLTDLRGESIPFYDGTTIIALQIKAE